MKNLMKKNLPPVGLRTIKTAIAVFLCLLLFPEEPFFACMTSVFCQQNNLKDSYKIGMARAYGTIHGAVCGLAFLVIMVVANSYIPYVWLYKVVSYFIISFGIIVVIYTCNLLNKKLSIPLACIVFLGVTTIHADGDPIYYGVNRVVETLFGLVIGLLVNKYIVPPKEQED